MALFPLDSSRGMIKKIIFIVRQTATHKYFMDLILANERTMEVIERECPDIMFWFLIPRNVNIGSVEVDQENSFRLLKPTEYFRFQVRGIKVDFDFRERARQILCSGIFGTRKDLNQIHDPTSPTDWIQDAFFVMRNHEGEVVLLDPYFDWLEFSAFNKNEINGRALAELVNGFIPSILSSQTGVRTRATRYYFQGGNVIGGNEFIFAGSDTLRKNLSAYRSDILGTTNWHTAFDGFMEELAFAFHTKRIICPGFDRNQNTIRFNPVPAGLNHLDQFLSYAGLISKDDRHHRLLLGEMYTWDGATWQRKPNLLSGRQRYLDMLNNWFTSPQFEEDFNMKFTVDRIPIFEIGDTLYYAPNCHLSLNFNHEKIAFVSQLQMIGGFTASAISAAEVMIESKFNAASIRPVFVPGGLFGAQNAGLHCQMQVLSRGRVNASM